MCVCVCPRSPAADVIRLDWSMLNVSSTASYAVRDIWAAADRGVFTGSYQATVPAHQVVYLTLTPS